MTREDIIRIVEAAQRDQRGVSVLLASGGAPLEGLPQAAVDGVLVLATSMGERRIPLTDIAHATSMGIMRSRALRSMLARRRTAA